MRRIKRLVYNAPANDIKPASLFSYPRIMQKLTCEVKQHCQDKHPCQIFCLGIRQMKKISPTIDTRNN